MPENVFLKEKLTYSSTTDTQYFDFDFRTRQRWQNMEYQHFHPFYEMFFFIKGECSYVIKGASYRIEPYDFILINKYLLHKSSYLRKENKRLLISFNKDFLSSEFYSQLQWILSIFENKVPIFRFENPEKRVIVDLINEFYTYIHKNDPACEIMLRNTLLRLLYTIRKYSDKNVYTNKIVEKNSISIKMQDITIYIHNNFHEKITLDGLAKKFFISPHYLSHKFKEYTNFSVTEYIQLTRIKKACELLIETNYKVIKISELCGFGSLSQFNRIFVKKVGMPPTKYRNDTKDKMSLLY